MNLPEGKGVYALVVEVERDIEIVVGSLGPAKLAAGYYVYVGSALGPGGLKARISRHLSKSKKLKWHIDYLLLNGSTRVIGVVCALINEKYECRIVKKLLGYGAYAPIRKFGAMDCEEKCPAHLLKNDKPVSKVIADILRAYTELGLKPLIFDYGYSALIGADYVGGTG